MNQIPDLCRSNAPADGVSHAPQASATAAGKDSAMITLYDCLSARSFRALWMLEEIGIHYELKALPLPPRALAWPVIEINPLAERRGIVVSKEVRR